MAIKSPLIYEIAYNTYAINEFGFACMYLAVGSEKALLIDTGCGVCDLPAVVKTLTDKPLIVAATHAHMDHVGGMGNFEQMYLNEKDWAECREVPGKLDGIRGYVESFGKSGGYALYDYSMEDVPTQVTVPELLPMGDGTVFELGGRRIEVFEIEGHTPGGCVLLDEANRIVFSGDCCNFNLLAPWCSVETTLHAIEKFKTLQPRFDQNFNGHAGYGSNPNCLSQPASVTDDLIHICHEILEGRGKPVPYDFLGEKLTLMKYGSARLSYDPRRLWDETSKE